MHPNALLELATDLLHKVMQFDAPADGVVSAFFREHRDLGPRERHTLAETTYAVLRQRLLFQHLAQSGKGEMERRLALLAWQGNAGFLRAALSEAEQKWLEQVSAIDRSTLPAKLRHNLPEWLAEPLQASLGDEFWPLVESLNSAAPLDLRVNTFKAKRDEVRTALAAANIDAQPTPYSPWGLRVQGKPALNKLDVFTRGDVEVQDEGSQLLALLTDAKRSEMVVDFCAGAGGKTLALGAAMRNTGRLYAFDISGHRLAALKPRLARSGLSNVYPVQIAHERDERIKRLAGKIDRGGRREQLHVRCRRERKMRIVLGDRTSGIDFHHGQTGVRIPRRRAVHQRGEPLFQSTTDSDFCRRSWSGASAWPPSRAFFLRVQIGWQSNRQHDRKQRYLPHSSARLQFQCEYLCVLCASVVITISEMARVKQVAADRAE